MDITTDVIDLTPELAKQFLTKNVKNRPISRASVDQFSGAIERGEWKLNGEGLKFDKYNNLNDGQHRCLAVIKANKTIRTFVFYGLETDAQGTMDVGRKRTVGDMLKLSGEKNAPRLAGALNILYTYEKTGNLYSGGVRPAPTAIQLIQFLETHPTVRDHMSVRSRVDYLLSPSVSTGLSYLFSSVDADNCKVFFDKLATGSGLSEGDPIFALRSRLENEAKKTHSRIQPHVRAALAIKAWNAWMEGRRVDQIRYAPGGDKPEAFPHVKNAIITPKA